MSYTAGVSVHGLWLAMAWLLGGGGLALGVWALFWDRPRGRRRCPKCWYDMGGVPGLRCPECGKATRTERHLSKTRRRYRWAAAGFVLLVAAFAVERTPAVRAGGLKALVPTTVLIAGMDWLPEPLLWQHRSHEATFGSLTDRLGRSEVARWQTAWLGRRCRDRMTHNSGESFRRASILGRYAMPADEQDLFINEVVLPRFLPALACPSPTEAVEALTRLAGYGFSYARRTALAEHVPSLIAAMASEDAAAVAIACEYAGVANCDPDQVLPFLERVAFHCADSDAVRNATWAVHLHAERHVSGCRSAERIVRDGPARARCSMLSALSLTGVTDSGSPALTDPGIVDAATLALDDADDEVAGQAARALLRLRPVPESLDRVLASMGPPRRQYSSFLGAIYYSPFRDKRMVPLLIRALEVDASESTIWVAPFVDDLGENAADLLPALREVARDNRFGEQAQWTAQGTIKRIERMLIAAERSRPSPEP